MIARTRKPPRGSFFLFGPRGTGKSTWVSTLLPDALRIDLLEEATYAELVGHAGRLETMADARRSTVVVVDEIQKLPSLLDEVHRLIVYPSASSLRYRRESGRRQR